MRAVDKRIVKAAIRRILQFAEAVGAGGGVGDHPGADGRMFAGADAEIVKRYSVVASALIDAVDASERGAFIPECGAKSIQDLG